jgi:hypothetical protein
LSIVDNGVGSLHVLPKDLDLHADKGLLNLVGMNGEIFWAPAGGAEARVSKLGWRSGGAYGLSGGAAEIEFVAYALNFALTRPAKLPVFDGAIAIEHFVMGNLGEKNMEVAFKGAVEPISMPLLAKAFGWPEFSGSAAMEDQMDCAYAVRKTDGTAVKKTVEVRCEKPGDMRTPAPFSGEVEFGVVTKIAHVTLSTAEVVQKAKDEFQKQRTALLRRSQEL